MNNKLETISNLFEGKEIRSHWNSDEEEYYFSVVDVINALTDSKNPNDYWYRLKTRMSDEEKSKVSTKCRQLKLKSKDGKYRETDVLDTKGILRLIESVPSPKAEPFKLQLANLGSERIDEVFNPELADDRDILKDAGKISYEIACDKALTEFEKYRIKQDKLYKSDFDLLIEEANSTEQQTTKNIIDNVLKNLLYNRNNRQ